MIRICAIVLLALTLLHPAALGDEPKFAGAVPGQALVFPKDHGKHPQFQTEWWYFTGNLNSEKNRKWGFQLTFFRRSLVSESPRKDSSWAVRDLYPAHFALADIENDRFFHTELLSREGPGLAHAASDRLDVRVKNWSAEQQGNRIRLKTQDKDYSLDLWLVPEKPPVPHGQYGYSRKGDAPDQASYYYSFTRLKAQGSVTFDGVAHEVQGLAWMDHEYGSSILLPGQVGWDWFSLQFDDGTELMVFHLRRSDGSFERPFGTLITKDGSAIDLADQGIKISSSGTWTSPRTGARYPSGWIIEVTGQKMSLELTPLMRDQEVVAGRSTRTAYWEGAVAAKGTVDGRPIQGRGYVELTGYAGSMAGKL
jgi:predicted secreted hydrolase